MTESSIPQVLFFDKRQILKIYHADDSYEINGVKYKFVKSKFEKITGDKYEGYTRYGVLYITDGSNVYKTQSYEYNAMKSDLQFEDFSYPELDPDYKLPKNFKF